MSIGVGEPDEDVEEEEEFHEVEDDGSSNKHRTSQESFQGDSNLKTSSTVSSTPISSSSTSSSTSTPQHESKKETNNTTSTEIKKNSSEIPQTEIENIADSVRNDSVVKYETSKSENSCLFERTNAEVSESTSVGIHQNEETTIESDLVTGMNTLVVSESDANTNDSKVESNISNQITPETTCEAHSESTATKVNDDIAKHNDIIDIPQESAELNSTKPDDTPHHATSSSEQNQPDQSKSITEDLAEKKNIQPVPSEDRSEDIKINTDDVGDQCNEKEKKSNFLEQPAKIADWADIMLSDNKESSNDNKQQDPSNVTEQDSADKLNVEASDKVDEKKLDLDEDAKNPQYIPKKGVFYEHDDRTADGGNSKKQVTATNKRNDDESTDTKDSANKTSINKERQNENRRGNRRQRSDNDRWDHDRFRYEQNKPRIRGEANDSSQDRPDRQMRNQGDRSRGSNAPNNSNNGPPGNSYDRQSGNQQDGRRGRNRGDRPPRQGQEPSDRRNNDRRSRRQSNRNRTDSSGPNKRDPHNISSNRPESNENKKLVNSDSIDSTGKQIDPTSNNTDNVNRSRRRDQNNDNPRNNLRNDSRGRRVHSKDRPNHDLSQTTSAPTEDKFPPINTVMPPMTTWSNKMGDMVKEDPDRAETSPSDDHKNSRSSDIWPVSNPNAASKINYHERVGKTGFGDDMNRQPLQQQQQQQQQQQHYNNPMYRKNRDDSMKPGQVMNQRGNFSDGRQNHHNNEWRRTGHYNTRPSNDYGPIKTLTFENSRLAQANMNRGPIRDAREILNEKRGIPNNNQPQQHQQMNFQQQAKTHSLGPHDQHMHHQRSNMHQPHHLGPRQQQQPSQQGSPRPHQMMSSQNSNQTNHFNSQVPNQPQSQHQIQHHHMQQQHPHHHPQHLQQHHQQPVHQRPTMQNQSRQESLQANPLTQPTQSPSQQTQQQPVNGINEVPQDNSNRQNQINPVSSVSSDLMSTRPIVKAADGYPGSINSNHSHGHQQQQHQYQPHQHMSQAHKSMGVGSQLAAQQGVPPGPEVTIAPTVLGAHMMHDGTSVIPQGPSSQYYPATSTSRDPSMAPLGAYHGYIPSGHSVIDTTRYHLTSQQLSDHGYMTGPPGQGTDVANAGGAVLHQPGMYGDGTGSGGTVASSAYLAAQAASSALSGATNIPVTGTGPPSMAPVSYMQHSQYAPPPYTNPYSQPPPQPNQPPPSQSNHPYPHPYWTYL